LLAKLWANDRLFCPAAWMTPDGVVVCWFVVVMPKHMALAPQASE
jgi:hypothetical protein